MRIIPCFVTFVFALCIPTIAQARPISYPGGWSFMTMNDPDMNSVQAYYTPDPRYSFGWRHDWLRGPEAHMDALQLNVLLKRWNNPSSQGNLYFRPGAGIAWDGDGSTEAAVYGGIGADWEDRRYYASYENEFLAAGDIERTARHKARVGVAPYVGGAGDLHTWLMLQADYEPGGDDGFSVTPLVRMFKGTVLGEAGVNLDGGVFFHLMLTY